MANISLKAGSQNGSSMAPHFFTVILSSEPRLRIPKKFVKKYGHNFPGLACLETRSGPVWQVELSRNNDEVWLEKGFQEFKEYYSIELGYFLVFRYDHDFNFHVVIYDTSACEIDYLCTTPIQNHQNNIQKSSDSSKRLDINESDEEVSIEDLDDSLTKRAAKRTKQTLKDSPMMEMPENMWVKVETQDLQGDITKKCNEGTRSHALSPVLRSKKAVKVKTKNRERSIAYQRAQSFKSNNPFIICFMQPSYVSTPYNLSISKIFSQKYLTDQTNFKLVLRVPDGRTWKIKCCTGSMNTKLHWRKFVQDNYLRVGDACVFEHQNDTKYPLLLNVTIFKTNQDTVMSENSRSKESSDDLPNDPSTSVKLETEQPFEQGVEISRRNQTVIETEKEKCIAYQRAKAFKSNNPFFISFMQRSYVTATFNLAIPKKFVQKYLAETHSDVVLRVSDGRTWKVKCYIGTSCALYWKKFAIDNELCVGDACVFERGRVTKCPFLNVTIFKNTTTKDTNNKNINDPSKIIPETGSHLQFLVPKKKRNVIEYGKLLAFQRANCFKSNNPFIILYMQPSYVTDHFYLCIPKTFAQNYLTDQNKCDVVLGVLDGRKWEVKCFTGSMDAKLLWKNFVQDNSLRVGDVCVFERDNENKFPFLNVVIYRTVEDWGISELSS